MRTLAILPLLLLLVLAGIGPISAAEESSSPSPQAVPSSSPAPLPAVNPICAQAFIAASSQAEPPTDVASEGPTEAPDALPAPATDRLDAAIRACSSLDDWRAGSQLYPGALRGADPMALLLERCIDSTAGLSAFATCRSLADALATPTPTPSPGPTLSPTPGPTATPPGENGQTSTEDAATPKRGADGLVRLPKRLTAKVPGATGIRYFSVGGRSASTLLKQTLKRAEPRCGIHRALACVNMSWRVQTNQAGGSGNCTIASISWTLSSVVQLPRWIKPNRVDPALLRWWKKVLKQSARHEARHIEIQKAELAKLPGQLVGKPCTSLSKVLKRLQTRSNKAQNAFDRREATKPLPPAP